MSSPNLSFGKGLSTRSLLHHIENVPNSKKLQTTTEMWLLTLYLICQVWALPIQQQEKDMMSKIWTNRDTII